MTDSDTTGTCGYVFDPAEHPDSTIDASWQCPHDAYNTGDVCMFHMSDEEREEAGITAEDLAKEIRSNLDSYNSRSNEYVGAKLPRLSFAYSVVNGVNNRQLNFQYATIDELDLTDSTVNQGIDFSHATLGKVTLDDCDIEGDLCAEDATIDHLSAVDATLYGDITAPRLSVTGPVDAQDTHFERKVYIEDADFKGDVKFDEVHFHEDISFSKTQFHGRTTFRASTFSGKSHELDDNADFTDAIFHKPVSFRKASVACATFKGAEFRAEAVFDHTHFSGDVFFDNAEFNALTDFEGAHFEEDAHYIQAHFHQTAHFDGAEFHGGSRTAEDDVSFRETVFHEPAVFEKANFRYANFEEAQFMKDAHFEEARFDADADFVEVTFDGEADFDEVRFYEDVSFEGSEFYEPAVFRGAEFRGESNHLEDNAVFDTVQFHKCADFDNATFTSGSFLDAYFGDEVDFSGVEFTDRADFRVHAMDTDTYVDMTNAAVHGGRITQTASGIVPYDFTEACLGDVTLDGETRSHELLDHFRFCLTEFNGFDFSNHHDYLERNNWELHAFVENDANFDYTVPMTPGVVEQTYKMAQEDAEVTSDKMAAAKFDIKRNRYNRSKNKKLAFDTTEPLSATGRLDKFATVAENYLMDFTCGYGSSLKRILMTTITTIIVSALFYMQGGFFKTGAGNVWTSDNPIQVIGDSLYYSIITITTVGYGDIGPLAPGSKAVASAEALMSVLILGLLVYTLGKRIDY